MLQRSIHLGMVGLILAHAGSRATADEIDVSGGWQASIQCGTDVAVIQTLQFAENLSTGVFDVSLGPSCGSHDFDGVVRPLDNCSLEAALQGAVSGSSFSIPPTGSFALSQTYLAPYASTTFPACSSFYRVDLQLHLTGAIQDDGMGRATRIDGYWGVLSYSLYNTGDALCASGSCGETCCTMTALRNDLAPGADQSVSPYVGSTVTFSDVAVGGSVIVTPLSEPAALVPANFQLLDTPIYFDVATTAQTSGPVTVCLPYPDANHDGIVDGTTPSIGEGDLLLLHEEGGLFVNRTSSVDPVANVICAQTSSLSQFVFGAATASCGDGNVDAGEDCDLGIGLNGSPSSCCTGVCMLRGAGETCRPAAGECNPAEICSGTTPACPLDALVPAGTPCSGVAPVCFARTCDGLGNCGNSPAEAGTPCDDALTCNGVDLCLDGACLHTQADCAVPVPLDSYKCHRIRDLQSPPFEKIRNPGISLDDPLGADPDVDVVRPFLLCNPADKENGGIVNSAATLCCYKINGQRMFPPPTIQISDDFGDLAVSAIKPHLVCQPCSATIAP